MIVVMDNYSVVKMDSYMVVPMDESAVELTEEYWAVELVGRRDDFWVEYWVS